MGSEVTMGIILQTLLWMVVDGRPQNSKIIFATDDTPNTHILGQGDCHTQEGKLYWLEDGQCYDIGERGPCNFGEVLWFLKKPICIPESDVPNTRTTDDLCNDEGMIYWPDNGLCYSLLTQGPCPEGQWLELSSHTPASASCATQPCDDIETSVFWPEICRCIPANRSEGAGYGPEDVCGPGSELVWSPYGEGVCICQDNYFADDQGHCYEVGSSGPCEDGYIWGADNDTDTIGCIENDNAKRLFDLIPANSQNGLPKSRITQTQRCYVDEKGKCRKTLNLRNRFGNTDSFSTWIASFERRSSEQCQVAVCDGDMVPWLDGKCYQLASTGPCQDGSWLVFDSVVDGNPIMKCKNKRCSDGIWWPKTCSCITESVLLKSQNLDFSNISNFVSPCGAKEELLVSPYGDGICGCQPNHVRDKEGECYEVGTQGPCEEGQVVSYEGGESSCADPANVVNRIFDLTNDCQCYNRKASDVCGVNEQLYDDIFGQGVCGCSPGHAIWEVDDACHPVHQQGPCEVGQLFVVGQDGRTECIQRNCTDGLLEIKSESEENCFEIGDTAPCEQGYQVGINPRSLLAECIRSEERLERVFDLIPATQNQHSNNGHNSVNKETCVLDKRGRCRRKLVLRRGANKDDGQEFQNWLESFIIRYDTTC